MTEKMERHGITPPGTFEPDILEQVLVKQVYSSRVSVLSAENTIRDAREWIKKHAAEEEYATFIVVDKQERLMGLVPRIDIFNKQYDNDTPITSLIREKIAYIYPNNQLSLAVDMMDKFDLDILPVVERDKPTKVIGILSRKIIFSVYHRRRNEEELFKQTISLKRGAIRLIVRGRQLFGWERDRR